MSFDKLSTNPSKVLILCKIPAKVERAIIHLKKAGYPTAVFTSMKAAVAYMLREKPKHIIISWNFSHNAKKFIRTFNQTFSVEAIPFVESSDRQSSSLLTKSGFKDIILFPLTGESTQRVLDRREGRHLKNKESAAQASSFSKIQIRINPEDIPEDGEWEEFADKKNSWFFKTDRKLKMFGKKNGRFVYQGEKRPERKPNGAWLIDTKKGKLEFEIINTIEEKAGVPPSDPLKQSNLTEEEAALKLATALGMNLDQLDNEVGIEDVLENEESDEALVDMEKLESEGLDDGVIIQDRKKEKVGLVYQERAPESEEKSATESGKKKSGKTQMIKGEEFDSNFKHFKGESKKAPLITQERPEEESYGSAKQEEKNSNDAGLIFQERAKAKDLSGVATNANDNEKGEIFEGDEATGLGATKGDHLEKDISKSVDGAVDLDGPSVYVEEKYVPRLEGEKSKMANLIHQACLGLVRPDEKYPNIVSDAVEIGVMTFVTEKFKGYLLCAANISLKEKMDFLDRLKQTLQIDLEKEKIVPDEIQISHMEIPRIHFAKWVKESADFVSYVQNKGNEIVVAFLNGEKNQAEISATNALEMVAVPVDSISSNEQINFDLYLYFPVNKKFILYVKKDDFVYRGQIVKMRKKAVDKVYIRTLHIPQYKLYCAKKFIAMKLESAKKFIKAG